MKKESIYSSSETFNRISKRRQEEFEKLQFFLHEDSTRGIEDTIKETKFVYSREHEPIKPKKYTVEEILLELKELDEFDPEPKYVKVEKQVSKKETIDCDQTEIKGKKTFKNFILFLRNSLKEDWDNFKRLDNIEHIEIVSGIALSILVFTFLGCAFKFSLTSSILKESTIYENYVLWATKKGIIMNDETFQQYRRDELGIEYEDLEEGYSRGGK